MLTRYHPARTLVLAVALLAVAMLFAACAQDATGPQATLRIGTTTSMVTTTGVSSAATTVRHTDHPSSSSQTAGSSTASSEGAGAAPVSLGADVAGWHQVELGVPGEALLDGRVAFDEDRAAWAESTLGHDDVYVLDLRTGMKKKVTDSRAQVTAIALDGTRLVWVARTSADLDRPATLVLYDLEDGAGTQVAEAPIPPGYMIQIVGDHIAWCQAYEAGDGKKTIGRLALFVYTISSGSVVKVSDRLVTGAWEPSGRSGYDLDVNYVAYLETANLNTDGEVWLYDLGAGSKHHLAHSIASSNHVSLQDDLVVWAAKGDTPRGAAYPAADVSVYRIHTQTSETIATIYSPAPLPMTDGRYVVWDDYIGDASFGLRTITGYDSKKDKLFDISQNALLNVSPEISDGLVVWEREGEPHSEIMARDLAAGQITQLSAGGADDQIARVHGRTVVWLKQWKSQDANATQTDESMIARAPERFRDAFSDVAGSYRYRTAVQAMFDWGLASGVKLASDRQYHADEVMRRGEFLQLVTRALDLGPTAALTDGGADQSAALTRAEAVSMVVRGIDLAEPGLLPAAGAEPPGAAGWDGPLRVDLQRAYAADLLSSLIDWGQAWDVSQPVTRAEAAQLVFNAVLTMR